MPKEKVDVTVPEGYMERMVPPFIHPCPIEKDAAPVAVNLSFSAFRGILSFIPSGHG